MSTITIDYLKDDYNWRNIRLADLETFMQRNGFEFHTSATHSDHWFDKISGAVVKVHAHHSPRSSGGNGYATRYSIRSILAAFKYRERLQKTSKRPLNLSKSSVVIVQDVPGHLANTLKAVRDGKNYTLFYESYPEFRRTFYVENGNAQKLMNEAGDFLRTTYSAAIKAIEEREAELKTKYDLHIEHNADGIIFTSSTLYLCEIAEPGISTTDAFAAVETKIQKIIDTRYGTLGYLEQMDFCVSHQGNTITISHPSDPENTEWKIGCDSETFLISADDYSLLQELQEKKHLSPWNIIDINMDSGVQSQ
jgi:hypothetical protein